MKFFNSAMNIFIFLVILSITFDNVLCECWFPSLFSFTNNFIHHIISIYLWFGSFIFGNYFYHLLFVCFVLVIQYFNKWDCPITLEYNKQCGFKLKEGHKDLIYWVNKNLFTGFPYYTYLTFLIVYDIYNLLINKIEF